MADRFSQAKRSEIMSRVRSADTTPEMHVRSFLHRLGYRFRLHLRDLPGRPDIVLPKYHTAIFVHGCFWHQHPGCPKAALPKTNVEKWTSKLTRNVSRDKENLMALQKAGWKVATIWECESKDPLSLVSLLSNVLSDLEERATANLTAI